MTPPHEMPPLLITPAPHLRSGMTSDRIFLETCVAMTPIFIVATGFFGLAFLKSLAGVLAGAFAAAALAHRVNPARFSLYDPPGLVTAFVLALTLPAGTRLPVAALGGFLAVTAGRNLFGGAGRNLFNPAMFGYACLLLAFPFDTVGGAAPVSPFAAGWFDPSPRATGATPLAGAERGLLDLAFGLKTGSPGEASSFMVLIGGAYLLARRAAAWQATAGMLLGALATSALLAFPSLRAADLIAPLFKGGLLFCAFFVATDPVTMPVRPRMRLLAGFLAGALTILLRTHTSLPEGAAFAILAVNCLTPFLDAPVHGVGR